MKAAPKPAPKLRKLRRRLGRASIMVIAALFAASAAIRFGDGIGHAFAVASPPPGTSDPACVNESGTMELLKQVQERERRVSEREGLLADRSQAIGLAEKRMEERLAALVLAEQKLAETVTIADKAADEDVARLVTVYENMKPKEAAPLFSAMTPDFAAGFLAKMRPEASAAVMANLEPQVAYTISVIMAGRNAGAPKN